MTPHVVLRSVNWGRLATCDLQFTPSLPPPKTLLPCPPPLFLDPPPRMQTGGKHFGAARTASLLLQEAGVAGFYRGVLSPVAGAGLIKAAVFGGYGLFQSIVRRVSGKGDYMSYC